ncbi:hypothetical protein A9Q81_27565 [Gammaproteobacteria bacterium 42_54_T18]|nr:hypothetical protein A9Q81_27565 [Gammaproteobacteria bacterium 42_54_T18]
MLISDVFHHVVDAIALETNQNRNTVQEKLKECFEGVFDSRRDIRYGSVKVVDEQAIELPGPGVSSNDGCVEIARIVFLEDSIRVIVLVGMWLPSDEESVWANLLYDMTYMIASSIESDLDVEKTQEFIVYELLRYIKEPSTAYTGQYCNTEQDC